PRPAPASRGPGGRGRAGRNRRSPCGHGTSAAGRRLFGAAGDGAVARLKPGLGAARRPPAKFYPSERAVPGGAAGGTGHSGSAAVSALTSAGTVQTAENDDLRHETA